MGLGPWPSCGVMGCGVPALFKMEFVEDGRPIWIHLCFVHIFEIKECLDTIAAVREEERALLEHETPDSGE